VSVLPTYRVDANHPYLLEILYALQPEDLVFIDVNGCLDETSPLHLACSVPASAEMFELLISYGADVNLPCGIKSSTPLQQAVQSGASLNVSHCGEMAG